MIRQTVVAAVLAGALVLGAALAATASTASHSAAAHPAASHPAAARTGPSRSGSADALVPLHGAARPLSGAALAGAAEKCAGWAADAGFASNGYLAGSLTTAVAVALAESGCNPAACHDNTTKSACPSPIPPGDSIDRGAWQLNNQVPDAASNKCAYNGPCSARNSYVTVSQDGTFFALWSTYSSDYYARFLPAAQEAVNELTAGTVTSGLAGSCLGYPRDKVNAAAILENCGSGAADQIWKTRGSTLRTGAGLCLAARSAGKPGTSVLRRCNGRSLQSWAAHGDASLYNAGARRCLYDPKAADKPGAVIGVEGCSGARDQTWYRP